MTERVNSESDERTANNAVRHTYRVLSEEEKATMVRLKDLGAALLAEIAKLGVSRETDLAAIKAEESVMWAVKHLTK